MRTKKRCIGLVAAALYVISVVLANYLTTEYGFVGVGFGYAATAGTLVIGGALVVRNFVQDAWGRIAILILIVVAGTLSYLVADPFIARASAAAFLISELLDMTVYTPLRKRSKFGGPRWAAAALAGAVVGAIADTIVFLWMAFGRAAIRPALPGQLLGKLEIAILVIAIGAGLRALLREPLDA